MKCKKFFPLFLSFLVIFMSGCTQLGIDNPFDKDPLTGGVDASTSRLLGVKIPAGLQVYPSHGYVETTPAGARQGLETYRGNIDGAAASLNLFNTLRQHGWELRLSLRKGDRSLALYQRDNDFAVIAFHRQGMLTIMEIWAGQKLPDGSIPGSQESYENEESTVSLPGEEYGPIEEEKEDAPRQGTVEQWGASWRRGNYEL